jgi:hypothetical protein
VLHGKNQLADAFTGSRNGDQAGNQTQDLEKSQRAVRCGQEKAEFFGHLPARDKRRGPRNLIRPAEKSHGRNSNDLPARDKRRGPRNLIRPAEKSHGRNSNVKIEIWQSLASSKMWTRTGRIFLAPPYERQKTRTKKSNLASREITRQELIHENRDLAITWQQE